MSRGAITVIVRKDEGRWWNHTYRRATVYPGDTITIHNFRGGKAEPRVTTKPATDAHAQP